MNRSLSFLAALAIIWLPPAQADELKLKDGSTIIGTIVAFEESSFKVQTSYGFAIVQRDQVLEIRISDSGKKPVADKAPQPAAAKIPTAAVAAQSPSVPAKDAEFRPAPPAGPMQNLQPSVALPAAPVIASPPRRSSAQQPPPIVVKAIARSLAAPSLPIAIADPPKPAPPEPIREEVTGNSYRNDTVGFRMYKPPDWQVIPDARALLPGSIVAMGTSDETTYLLIGQQPAGKSLATDVDATEHRLSSIMDNFRPVGEGRRVVSGIPAIERRFRGTVDQREWSGIVVFLPRNGQIFTVFGMTYAESDLVQIQENVLDRAVSSIQFMAP